MEAVDGFDRNETTDLFKCFDFPWLVQRLIVWMFLLKRTLLTKSQGICRIASLTTTFIVSCAIHLFHCLIVATPGKITNGFVLIAIVAQIM